MSPAQKETSLAGVWNFSRREGFAELPREAQTGGGGAGDDDPAGEAEGGTTDTSFVSVDGEATPGGRRRRSPSFGD